MDTTEAMSENTDSRKELKKQLVCTVPYALSSDHMEEKGTGMNQ